MNKKLFNKIFFLILLAILFFISTKVNFTYGQTVEEFSGHDEWQFFHEQLLDPSEAQKALGTGQSITVPHNFQKELGSALNYGTYVKQIKLPKAYINEQISLYIPFEYANYKLYVNDKLVLEQGNVADNAQDSILQMGPAIGHFYSEQQEVTLTFQLSNYESIRGGFAKSILIGFDGTLAAKFYTSTTSFFFVMTSIFLLGLFILRLSIVRKNKVTCVSHLLASICITFSVRSIFARPYLYALLPFDLTASWAAKIEAFSTVIIMILFIRLCQEIMAPMMKKSLFVPAYVLAVIQGLFVICTESIIYQQTFLYLFFIHFYYIPFYLLYFIILYEKMAPEKRIQFFGVILLALATIHDVLVVYQILDHMMLIQMALIIYALLQIILISHAYESSLKEVLLLNNKITNLNASLEKIVAKRTEELVLVNKQLELLAFKDPLTGIANRHIFNKTLDYYFQQTFTKNKAVTLFLLDLDYFKQYNDTYGHQAGDELLKAFVQATLEILPPSATFVRFGGEEFAIISDDVTLNVEQLAAQIVQHIGAQQFKHESCESGYLTISLGAYHLTNGHSFTQPTELINAADQELYKVKAAGKNNWSFAQS